MARVGRLYPACRPRAYGNAGLFGLVSGAFGFYMYGRKAEYAMWKRVAVTVGSGLLGVVLGYFAGKSSCEQAHNRGALYRALDRTMKNPRTQRRYKAYLKRTGKKKK